MSADLPAMRNHAPASRLTGYRLFMMSGFDVRLNMTWLLLDLLISPGWRAHTARRYPHREPHRLVIRPGSDHPRCARRPEAGTRISGRLKDQS